jgi:RNA polymerase sigma factor (sigma-70 family)
MGLLVQQLRSASLTTLVALSQAEPGDDTAPMGEIILRFEPLTRKLARGITVSRQHLYDDVANACRVALVRATRRHDTTRAGFPAYAERFMRGAALRELNRWRVADSMLVASPDEENGSAGSSNFESEIVDEMAPWGDGAIAEAVGMLSASQQEIATMRYVEDAPLDVIASGLGTSVSAVSQRLNTIHRKVEVALAA